LAGGIKEANAKAKANRARKKTAEIKQHKKKSGNLNAHTNNQTFIHFCALRLAHAHSHTIHYSAATTTAHTHTQANSRCRWFAGRRVSEKAP